MTPLPELTRLAVEAGVLDAQAAAQGRMASHEQCGTHHVRALVLDGTPIAIAKWPGSAAFLDGDDPVRAEAHALRLLADSGLVPAVIHRSGSVLLTEPVHPGRSIQTFSRPVPSSGLAVAWGAALARLHRWPTTGSAIVPRAPKPWVLKDGALPQHIRQSTVATIAARELLADETISAALRRAAAHWDAAAEQWIHGDATNSNAIARQDYAFPVSEPRWRIWLIDLESAGLGDAAWDVATAVDSIEVTALQAGVDADVAVSALLAGYDAAGGPAVLSADLRVARAVLSATQAAAWSNLRPDSDATDPTSELMRRARDLAAQPTTAVADGTASGSPDALETACAGAWR